MDNIYLSLIILLGMLAIFDLIVGVSNDAVNFLNSAIGSKAISFRNIMLLASIGIFFGAVFSSGMMEVARKGIFYPGSFYFDEIVMIFMAVMLTDILLLDFFNTIGLPTSTTVSIVFELLGASVIMALIKISNNTGSFSELTQYINIDKAAQIVLGILLSIFIAFTIGAIIQFISRIIFSFNFEKKSFYLNGFFGGIAITCIFNFIFLKSFKSTSYSEIPIKILNDTTINEFLVINLFSITIISFLFWFLISYAVIRFLKWDIYKIIIGLGTFALALAFASNDLVNFIGVPVAAYQAYKVWISSGISADALSMELLNYKVPTPEIFLYLSGVIMILTLWFSSKAKKVVKTSIDLSNQNNTIERFKPNYLSRFLVSVFVTGNNYVKKFIPIPIIEKVNVIFNPTQINQSNNFDSPAFDKLRASINLIVASVLIATATSFKLPLSTTYVVFMVAMGSSLADRAWGSDSAVYRVAGVINVIGGWFLTAFLAFLVSGIIVFLINLGGIQVIALILLIILFLISKNFINYRKEIVLENKENKSISVNSNSYNGVINELGKVIEKVFEKTIFIFDSLINGLSKNEIKELKIAKNKSKKLIHQIQGLYTGILFFIKNLDEKSISVSQFYIDLTQHLNVLTEDLEYLSKISYEHVHNNHKKLKYNQILELISINEKLNKIFLDAIKAFGNRKDLMSLREVLNKKHEIIAFLDEKIINQIKRAREEETSPKNTTLYFKILIRTKALNENIFLLMDKFFKVVEKI